MFVRTRDEMKTVQALWAAGLNKCAISRATGIPRSTVKSWLLGGMPTGNYRNAREPALADLPAADYAYLLGMYLGDGHIARSERTYLLRVSCDAQYVEIMAELEGAIRAVAPSRAVSRTSRPGRCIMVSAYWKHWPTVFPQHGPGYKHARRIELTAWQRRLTTTEPGRFVRGLIHSDGCRYVARQPTRNRRGTYSYVRYSFSNRSADNKRLFCEHLNLLSVDWTQANEFNIQIARKSSVEILEGIVGPKS
jgi:hypothetical protein